MVGEDRMYKRANDLVEIVRSQTNIVDLISEYILLTPKGRYYSGLCPFHQEKTPSFTVTPDKQIFYCFGCGTGGDVFSFLMKKEGINFVEALNKLAARANIPTEGQNDFSQKSRESELKLKVFELNRVAARFFYACLTRTKDGKNAFNYLLKRGIKSETIRRFGLGYAPNSWTALYDYLTAQGFEGQLMEQAGLVIPRKNGDGYYDRFRNRVVFPIIDLRGRVCGFGGRVLGEEQPKYLNSPETPVFSKSKNLYGLNLAKDAIRESGTVVLMEGYMDVFSAHQIGCGTAVASLGTALTSQHCRILSSLAREVVLVYDGDAAGGRAVLKGIQLLKKFNLTLKVCSLPRDTDPDDYIRRYGGNKFLDLIGRAVPFYDFQIGAVLQANDLNLQEEKIRAIKSVLPILLSIEDINERDEYIKKVVNLFKLPEENLRLQLKKAGKEDYGLAGKGVNFSSNRHNNRKQPSEQVLNAPFKLLTAPIKAQQGLLKLIVNKSGYLDYIQSELELKHFTDPEYRKIFANYLALKQEDGEVDHHQMLGALTENEKQIYACLLTEDEENLEMEEKAVQDYIKCLQTYQLQSQIENLQREIEQCELEGRQEELLELLNLLQDLKRSSNPF